MKRSTVMSCIGAAIVCGAAAWMATADLQGTAATALARPLQVRWEAGRRYTYSLSWETTQESRLPGASSAQALAGHTDLEADLLLDVERSDASGATLVGRFDALRRHDLTILGKAALADATRARASLVGPAVEIEVAASGAVREMRFAADAPDVFKHWMQAVLTQAQVVVADGASAGSSWTVELAGLHGTGPVTFSASPGEPVTLVAVRSAYTNIPAVPRLAGASQRLKDHADVALAPEGHLVRLTRAESVQVTLQGVSLLDADTRFALELRSIGQAVARAAIAGAGETRRPGEVRVGASTERNLWTNQADGLTVDALLADLGRFATTGHLPESGRWTWRAVAVLKLHPEACARLVDAFRAGTATRETRALVADLLASVGHGAAQAALRDVLRSPMRTANEEALLFQRLSRVDVPDADTVAFVRAAQAEAPEGVVRTAASYTAGAVARHAAAAGDLAGAQALLAPLTEALADRATEPSERAHAIRALGNSGSLHGLSGVLDHADAEASEVRHAVATALRRSDTPQAEAGLVSLAADRDSAVQATALSSLGRRPLTPESWAGLAAAVARGAVTAATAPEWVTFLAAHLDAGEPPLRLLRALEVLPAVDGRLRARIRNVLARAG